MPGPIHKLANENVFDDCLWFSLSIKETCWGRKDNSLLCTLNINNIKHLSTACFKIYIYKGKLVVKTVFSHYKFWISCLLNIKQTHTYVFTKWTYIYLLSAQFYNKAKKLLQHFNLTNPYCQEHVMFTVVLFYEVHLHIDGSASAKPPRRQIVNLGGLTQFLLFLKC